MKCSPNGRSIMIAMLILLAPLSALAGGQVGEHAAEFNLPDTNGVSHALSDHLGEVCYLFMVGYG